MFILLAGCVFLSAEELSSRVDLDGDGVAASFDCDDADAARAPGLAEACNGWDDDCDGLVDEDLHPDDDGDHFGATLATTDGATTTLQTGPCYVSWVTDATDCDDTNADAHPGATEVCDGAVNGCTADGAPLSEAGLATFTPADGSAIVEYGPTLDAGVASAPAIVTLETSGTLRLCASPTPRHVAWVVGIGAVEVIGVVAAGEDPEDPDAWPAIAMGDTDVSAIRVEVEGLAQEVSFSRLTVYGATGVERSAVELIAGNVTMDHVRVEGFTGYGETSALRVQTDLSGEDLRFSGNSTYACGAAMRVESPARVALTDSVFSSNVSTFDGGALCLLGGTTTLTGVTVGAVGAGNHANQRGAGAFVDEGASLVLNDCLFTENVVEEEGDSPGGAAIYTEGDVDMSCTEPACADGQGVCGNTSLADASPAGGGLVVDGKGTVVVYDCQIGENTPDDLVTERVVQVPAGLGADFWCDEDGCDEGAP